MLKNLSRRNFVRSLLGGAAVPAAAGGALAACPPAAPPHAGLFIVMGVNFEGDDPNYPAGEYLADGRIFPSEELAAARATELHQKWRTEGIPEHYIGDFHSYPLDWAGWDDETKYDYLMGLCPQVVEHPPGVHAASGWCGLPDTRYSFWDTVPVPFFVKELVAHGSKPESN